MQSPRAFFVFHTVERRFYLTEPSCRTVRAVARISEAGVLGVVGAA